MEQREARSLHKKRNCSVAARSHVLAGARRRCCVERGRVGQSLPTIGVVVQAKIFVKNGEMDIWQSTHHGGRTKATSAYSSSCIPTTCKRLVRRRGSFVHFVGEAQPVSVCLLSGVR